MKKPEIVTIAVPTLKLDQYFFNIDNRNEYYFPLAGKYNVNGYEVVITEEMAGIHVFLCKLIDGTITVIPAK